MADTPWATLLATASTNVLQPTDGLVLARAGLPRAFNGQLPSIDASGRFGFGTAAPRTKVTVIPATNPVDATGSLPLEIGEATDNLSYGLRLGPALLSGTWVGVINMVAADTGAPLLLNPSGGPVLAGVQAGAYHRFVRTAATGTEIFQADNAVAVSLQCRAVDQNNFSLTNAAALVGRNSTTGRSINAGGTINASGADYAEYMTKAPGCGEIAKGDVCGVDRSGKLTRIWEDSVSFVVKSTDPSYVGGDIWATHLGEKPQQKDDESDGRFARRLATFEAGMEKARATVDRIAFCGQVPVNVSGGCAVGDYIIAVANGAGIKAVAVPEAEIAFEQYRRRLGKVWAIRDGRPIIDVQHG